MELQVQELIEQIKREGLETAEAEATVKMDAARAEAERIIAEARAEAEDIVRKAKEESDRFVRAGEDALRQAGRNVLLSFRESVTKELDGVLGKQVTAVYSSGLLADLIVKVVEALAKNGGGNDMELLLGSEDMARLENELLSALKKKMLGGVTLRVGDRVTDGFCVGFRDEDAYYDFSAASVTEMLSAYLNPRLTALLKEAEGK